MTLLLSLNVGDGRLLVLLHLVTVGVNVLSYVTVLGNLSMMAYCDMARTVLFEKTSLYVSDCHGVTVVSLTNFCIPKSGLITGIVIYAGSDTFIPA